MSRITSYNLALLFDDGFLIHPKTIGEFGEGEEGRIDVADGSRKYKVRDQIFDIGEIELEIYIAEDSFAASTYKKDGEDADGNVIVSPPWTEYTYFQDWVANGGSKDLSIVALDVSGKIKREWRCTGCELAMGKKNAFDRGSKSEDTKKYFLLPSNVYDATEGMAEQPCSPGTIPALQTKLY